MVSEGVCCFFLSKESSSGKSKRESELVPVNDVVSIKVTAIASAFCCARRMLKGNEKIRKKRTTLFQLNVCMIGDNSFRYLYLFRTIRFDLKPVLWLKSKQYPGKGAQKYALIGNVAKIFLCFFINGKIRYLQIRFANSL